MQFVGVVHCLMTQIFSRLGKLVKRIAAKPEKINPKAPTGLLVTPKVRPVGAERLLWKARRLERHASWAMDEAFQIRLII
jgi:hypothetical protein